MYCGELVTDLLTAITTCRLNSISSTPVADVQKFAVSGTTQVSATRLMYICSMMAVVVELGKEVG